MYFFVILAKKNLSIIRIKNILAFHIHIKKTLMIFISHSLINTIGFDLFCFEFIDLF